MKENINKTDRDILDDFLRDLLEKSYEITNWFKVKEIRLGLEAGLDAKEILIYAKHEFSWEQMIEIRWGLEAGIDVSIYAKLDSEGKPVYNDNQMFQIAKGLKAGLDVSIYTELDSDGKPLYSDDKMYEILRSLETGLPKEIIKQEIAKPELSDKEMEEIREKLDKELYELGEEGLLAKYGITPEKENSEVEKDENTLDASEEISL